MAEALRKIEITSRLPSRDSAVAALFAGWGVFHLIVALLNAGSSTAFFVEWFALLGVLLISSGWLLYRRHRVGVLVGLITLCVLFVSNIYNTVVYGSGVDSTYLSMEFILKLGIAYLLVTIARNRADGSSS